MTPLKAALLLAGVGAAAAQTSNLRRPADDGAGPLQASLYRAASLTTAGVAPRAYEYGYQLDDTNGSHGHVEKRDEQNRVEGEYSINLGDGRVRVVKYVADENGYRADVTTDELGTESKNPNDVYIGSTALSGYEAALKYGPFAPPHVEPPLVPAPRPEAPRQIQVQAANSKVALPTYGTFAG